ncbi:uncharacterized protein FFFS_03243 [Fusarium fujikuroi]|nr:uncharacterized protein FFFS_03243 [Fusarium fujikuroi]
MLDVLLIELLAFLGFSPKGFCKSVCSGSRVTLPSIIPRLGKPMGKPWNKTLRRNFDQRAEFLQIFNGGDFRHDISTLQRYGEHQIMNFTHLHVLPLSNYAKSV